MRNRWAWAGVVIVISWDYSYMIPCNEKKFVHDDYRGDYTVVRKECLKTRHHIKTFHSYGEAQKFLNGAPNSSLPHFGQNLNYQFYNIHADYSGNYYLENWTVTIDGKLVYKNDY